MCGRPLPPQILLASRGDNSQGHELCPLIVCAPLMLHNLVCLPQTSAEWPVIQHCMFKNISK